MSFLYVGRLDELKGIKVLFEAWRLMGADAPHLIVCGKGPLEDWCTRQAQGLNIEMKGYVENRSVRQIISQSEALVLPTLWYEGFPMTIVEAFSAGIPVICSDLGNSGSLIEDGVTGWKFKAGSAEGLIEAIKKRQRQSSNISDSVRQVFEDYYTPDANYRCLTDIYTEVKDADRSSGDERRELRK